jgi:hypothetical protein
MFSNVEPRTYNFERFRRRRERGSAPKPQLRSLAACHMRLPEFLAPPRNHNRRTNLYGIGGQERCNVEQLQDQAHSFLECIRS